MDSLVEWVSVYHQDTLITTTQVVLIGVADTGARPRVYATTADFGVVLST